MDCTSLFLQEKLDPPSMIFRKSQPPLNKGEGGRVVLTNITSLVVSATSGTGGYLVFFVIRKLVC